MYTICSGKYSLYMVATKGGENMKLNEVIRFRLSTEEKEQIRKAAKEANMTLTQYMRYKIFGK